MATSAQDHSESALTSALIGASLGVTITGRQAASRAFEAILALKSDSQNRPFERDKSTAASRNAKRSVDITIEDGLPLAVLSACFV
jgi:hypothetical protein